MTSRAHNPAARWTFCHLCHHRGYHNRGDAKAVRKRHPGEKGLAVFVCPHTPGLFHLGHRPEALNNGQIDRQRLRHQAIRTKRGHQRRQARTVRPCARRRDLRVGNT